MFRLFIFVLLVICLGFAGSVAAQDTAQRTHDLVAALDKTKYKKKEKANISIELFVDVKNEPALRADATEYSGHYESDGYRLDLTVAKDGTASGSGFDYIMDSGKPVSFTLRNARVDGALLTATKVYENGSEQVFEGVFVNRTARTGSNPKAVTTESIQFGLGFIQHGSSVEQCDPAKATKPDDKNATVADIANRNGSWTNRVFLERK